MNEVEISKCRMNVRIGNSGFAQRVMTRVG